MFGLAPPKTADTADTKPTASQGFFGLGANAPAMESPPPEEAESEV